MAKNDKISQIISLMFTTRRLMHERISGDKTKSGFSLLQFIALKYIREKRPLMKELADFLSITPPSATSLIDTLIKAGLINRQSDPDDRRIVRIGITKKGEAYIKRGIDKASEHMRESLKKLSVKEQDELINILNKIIQA